MKELMQKYPKGGIVFSESTSIGELMVTNDFGATDVVPDEGELFYWDFNIDEYADSDKFAVFDSHDVALMIQTLIKGLKANVRVNNNDCNNEY